MDERIGCLEFYCRIRSTGNDVHRFSIEEDFRKRMHLQYHHPSSPSSWRLTYAFPPSVEQNGVFETLGNAVADWTFDGFNACVLSMGPTKSGKSHSIFDGGNGLAANILNELFRRAQGSELTIGLSMWDIKSGVVRDGFALLRSRPNVVEKNEDGYYQFDAYRVWSANEATAIIEAFDRVDDEGHRFIRACLIDSARGVLSTVNLCDLKAKQADFQALKPMLETLSASARPFGESSPPPNSEPLTMLLYPLIGGNSKTYLLMHVREEAEGSELRDSLELLDLAERASLVSTLCTKVPCKDVVLEPLPYSLRFDSSSAGLSAPENTELNGERSPRRSRAPPEETESNGCAYEGILRRRSSGATPRKDESECQQGCTTFGMDPKGAEPAPAKDVTPRRARDTAQSKPQNSKSDAFMPASRASNKAPHPRDIENLLARPRSPPNGTPLRNTRSPREPETTPRSQSRRVSWMQPEAPHSDAASPSTLGDVERPSKGRASGSTPMRPSHARRQTSPEKKASASNGRAFASNFSFELDTARARIRELESELQDVRTNVKEFETIKELEVQDIRLELVRAKRGARNTSSTATLDLDEENDLRREVAWLRGQLDGKCDPKKITAKMLAELQELRKEASEMEKTRRSQKATERFSKEVGQKFVRTQQLARDKAKELELTKTKLDELEGHFLASCNELRRTENELSASKECIEELRAEIAVLKEACYYKYKKPEEILTKFLHESTVQTKNRLLEQFRKLQRALDSLHIEGALRNHIPALLGRLKEEIEALVEQNSTLENKTSQLVKIVHQQASEDLHDGHSATSRRSIGAPRTPSRRGSGTTSASTAVRQAPGDRRPSGDGRASLRSELRSTHAVARAEWSEERRSSCRRTPSVPMRDSSRPSGRNPFGA